MIEATGDSRLAASEYLIAALDGVAAEMDAKLGRLVEMERQRLGLPELAGFDVVHRCWRLPSSPAVPGGG